MKNEKRKEGGEGGSGKRERRRSEVDSDLLEFRFFFRFDSIQDIERFCIIDSLEFRFLFARSLRLHELLACKNKKTKKNKKIKKKKNSCFTLLFGGKRKRRDGFHEEKEDAWMSN